MPIYDYRCKECSTLYDILHKGKEIIEDIQCPSCGSNQYKKLLSLPSIITKEVPASHCDTNACTMERSCCGGACGLD